MNKFGWTLALILLPGSLLTTHSFAEKSAAPSNLDRIIIRQFRSGIRSQLISDCRNHFPLTTRIKIRRTISKDIYFKQCQNVARKLIEVIDCRINEEMTGMTCFHEELLELMEKSEVHTYLSELGKMDEKENLWKMTLDHTHGDEKMALKWIAVLLQDASHSRSHLTAIKDLIEPQAFQVLQEALYRVHPGGMTGERLYPSVQIPPFLRAFYHFYVPAYLTLKLKDHFDGDWPGFMTFLFNNNYEYIDMKKSGGIINGRKMLKYYFIGYRPKTIEPTRYFENLSDIYLGLMGSLWSNGTLNYQTAPRLGSFVSDFGSDRLKETRVHFTEF